MIAAATPWVSIVGGAIGVAGLVGLVIGALLARATQAQIKTLRESVETFSATNGELRDSLNFERSERQRESEVFTQRLHEQEVTYKAEIGELRGVVKVYESGFAERLVALVVPAIAQALKESA